jgi:histidine ammonia-lyase
MSAKKALEKIGSAPLVLEPKEGLALLNGTQVSTALLLEALFSTQPLFETQILAGALSLFATQSDLTPFDPRIQLLRRMKAQSDVAAILYFLLEKTIVAEKNDYSLVQDPYSLRCQPQVMGACLTQFRYVAENIANEVNAVTDNPLIFSEDNEILSGGNFHAQWIGLGADAMACALATMANISERRIALFMDPNLSRLPAFLVNDSGENSGFMLAHVTAAALASENKVLAHPASVDTIPTSSNQEDHVSMATFAARRLQEIIENTTTVIAIELLCAAQGVDFHQDMNLPERIKPVYETIRRSIPFHEKDRYMAEAIAQLKSMVEKRDFRLLRGDCDFF